MNAIGSYYEFNVYLLTKEIAETYIKSIVKALNLIPQVDKHKNTIILSDYKEDRKLHAKWNHSIIALTDKKDFAGIIIGYERERENNEKYPDNCIYLSELAVLDKYQKRGLGKYLLNFWLDYNRKIGFKELNGVLKFCVQTNNAEWNRHVQKLYESYGFKKTAEKLYNNRIDNIYTLVYFD